SSACCSAQATRPAVTSSPSACSKCSSRVRRPATRRRPETPMNLHPQLIIDTSYFAAAFLFIYGLKRMSSPVTARSGIVVAGWGMLVAVLASFLYYFGVSEAAKPHLAANAGLAALALGLGVAWAWWSGKRVAMTAMPQMVALYNGMGGGSAAAIAAMVLLQPVHGEASGWLHY